MLRRFTGMMIVAGFLYCPIPVFAVTATVNTDAAWAVLNGLENRSLSYEEAKKVAQLPGNQAAIRKLQSFKIAASTDSFAKALVAAAHGELVNDRVEQAFLFEMLKPKMAQIKMVLRDIEDDKAGFQGAIGKRIDLYAPAGSDIILDGYIVAAGDGGGYAFGDTNFYLNLIVIDEFVVVKNVTTHEMYHAVQGAFASEREALAIDSTTGQNGAQPSCEAAEQLFMSMYREGSAVEVSDFAMLDQAHSERGAIMRNDMADNLKRLDAAATLLDMSVMAMSGPHALPYDDVYAVGFYGHGTLYGISYVMARAIAENDGTQGLAAFLKKPSYEFLLRYTQLPLYGHDAMHPKLGTNTIGALQRLARQCH